MKKFFLSVLPVAAFIVVSCGGGQPKNSSTTTEESKSSTTSTTKKYEIKSGIVHYKPFEIMGVKSTQTLYFDDYGNKEVSQTDVETNMMGYTAKEQKIVLKADGYSTSFDLIKVKNGKDELVKEAQKSKLLGMGGMSSMAATAMGDEMKKQMDFKEEGTEQIAGVTGKKFSMAMNKQKPDQRIYSVTYKNLMLRTEMGGIKIEAVKVEENVDIPSSKFQIPADYKIIDADATTGSK